MPIEPLDWLLWGTAEVTTWKVSSDLATLVIDWALLAGKLARFSALGRDRKSVAP